MSRRTFFATVFIVSVMPRGAATGALQQDMSRKELAPSQRELNGFLLGQYSDVSANHFGEPFQVLTTRDGWTQKVFILDRKKNAYMVFGSDQRTPTRIDALQITGDPDTKMLPFFGVRLGDKSEVVFARFGKPTSKSKLEDNGATLCTYASRNYSFEFSPAGKLASIRITEFAGFPDAPWNAPDISVLKGALSRRDVDGLLDCLASDVEISLGARDMVRFEGPARHELMDIKSRIRTALLGEAGSLRAALLGEGSPDVQVRVYESGEPAYVLKWPDSKVLEEIVYKEQAGKLRVWEVRFR